MKRFTFAIIVAVLLVCFSEARADENNKIRVQYQIFKFYGDLQGETYEDGEIWTTGEAPDKLKDLVTVFSRGKFEMGRNDIEFKNGRVFLGDKEVPITELDGIKFPRRRIVHVGSAEVMIREHSSGKVSLQAMQPLQYFEKREDGLFELKEIELPTGFDLEVTKAVEEEDDGFIRLTDIEMTMRSVEKREQLQGVNLNVGKPVIGKQRYEFYFRLRPDKDYGIIVKPKGGQGGLLIRLRVTSTASKTLSAFDIDEYKRRQEAHVKELCKPNETVKVQDDNSCS